MVVGANVTQSKQDTSKIFINDELVTVFDWLKAWINGASLQLGFPAATNCFGCSFPAVLSAQAIAQVRREIPG